MADVDVVVTLRLSEVLLEVQNATNELLTKAALRVEEYAKLNIRTNDQIDTGFMVNSIYTVTSDQSGYGSAKANAEAQKTNRDGEVIDHEGDMSDEVALAPGAVAGVVVGAKYAIYQEDEKPFLYPAGEKTAADMQQLGNQSSVTGVYK